MRFGAVALMFGVGCASHREPPAPSRPVASNESRCTLRISLRGTFVDGEPMSRTDAVNYCKRTDGAMVVIEDEVRAPTGSPRVRLSNARACQLPCEGRLVTSVSRSSRATPLA